MELEFYFIGEEEAVKPMVEADASFQEMVSVVQEGAHLNEGEPGGREAVTCLLSNVSWLSPAFLGVAWSSGSQSVVSAPVA